MRKFAAFPAVLLAGLSLPFFAAAQDGIYGAEGGAFRRFSSGLEAPKLKDASASLPPDQSAPFEAVRDSQYLVGPDDQFQVVYGDKAFVALVNSEGDLIVDGVPPIRVAGKTLLAARKIIGDAVSRQYRGDRVYITLSKAKRFRVSLAGEFVKPGFHVMHPGARVSDAIESAEGYAYLASRKLVLTTSAGVKREIDLSGYYKRGDLDQNPALNQGDRIFAPAVDFSADFVQVRDSQSVRAMPIAEGDDLETLLLRMNNYDASREWQFVRVFRAGKMTETVSRSAGSTYRPKSGDLLEVHAPLTKVFVGGTVIQPGEIQYDPRLNLSDYIARSGITINTSRNFESAVIVSADGKARNAGSPVEPILPGDHIWVPRSREAQTRDYLVLISSVSSLAVAVATLFVLIGQ
jgi:protein involved in polysaccharide export with SLBB domain